MPSQKTISATARTIALATIFLAHDPKANRRALVAPGASDWCQRWLSTNWRDRILCASAKSAWLRWFWQGLERLILPGIVTHYWARKARIEKICRASISSGIQRVIVLGAGFDTLALRLSSEFKDIEFVEIDHPSTQSAKRACLRDMDLPTNLQLIAADLTQSGVWVEAINTRPTRTLVIAEGVLMYLTSERVAHLVRQLSTLNPMLLMSYMLLWPDGAIGFRHRAANTTDSRNWVARWLRWVKEPFLFALDEDAVSEWLSGLNMQLVEHIRSPISVDDTYQLRGENLVLAQSDSSGRAFVAHAQVRLKQREAR